MGMLVKNKTSVGRNEVQPNNTQWFNSPKSPHNGHRRGLGFVSSTQPTRSAIALGFYRHEYSYFAYIDFRILPITVWDGATFFRRV